MCRPGLLGGRFLDAQEALRAAIAFRNEAAERFASDLVALGRTGSARFRGVVIRACADPAMGLPPVAWGVLVGEEEVPLLDLLPGGPRGQGEPILSILLAGLEELVLREVGAVLLGDGCERVVLIGEVQHVA
jgi:hypothetical protein